MSIVSVIAIISSPNVLTTVSSQGLRGRIKTHGDHFSNDDLIINSPISLELLSFTEEAQLEERLEEDAESVPQEDLKADMIVEISDEAIIENNDGPNDSIEVLPEVTALNA